MRTDRFMSPSSCFSSLCLRKITECSVDTINLIAKMMFATHFDRQRRFNEVVSNEVSTENERNSLNVIISHGNVNSFSEIGETNEMLKKKNK